jgi:hypothetical protein
MGSPTSRARARVRLAKQLQELVASRPETQHLAVAQRILLVRDILRAVDDYVDDLSGGQRPDAGRGQR